MEELLKDSCDEVIYEAVTKRYAKLVNSLTATEIFAIKQAYIAGAIFYKNYRKENEIDLNELRDEIINEIRELNPDLYINDNVKRSIYYKLTQLT